MKLGASAFGPPGQGPAWGQMPMSQLDPLQTLVRAAKLDANVVKEIEVSILKV